jgi:hypothetical protein
MEAKKQSRLKKKNKSDKPIAANISSLFDFCCFHWLPFFLPPIHSSLSLSPSLLFNACSSFLQARGE